jgi:hypothetical protein
MEIAVVVVGVWDNKTDPVDLCKIRLYPAVKQYVISSAGVTIDK